MFLQQPSLNTDTGGDLNWNDSLFLLKVDISQNKVLQKDKLSLENQKVNGVFLVIQ